jgi:hypothetical protein
MPGLGNDLDKELDSTSTVKVTGGDEARNVDVLEIDGRNRMLTDTRISSVNVPLGKDPLPDTYFNILTAGAIGDTVIVDIAATANDSTSPDSDFPTYQLIYTLVAVDVGDERQLSINIADALNADPLFEAQFLEAYAIGDDGDENLRPVIHITSTRFSLNGEFYERPNIGDFDVTATGTTTVSFFSSEYQTIVSRPKEVSLARDPRNPHRLGVQNISGTVFIRSSDPDALVRQRIQEVGNTNDDMAINGQGTPVVFELASNPDGGADIIIDSLKFYGTDTNIKVSDGNFLGQNSPLANGILLELIRDGLAIFTELIINTPDMLGLFSSSASDNKIINQSGGDYFESTFSLIDKNLAFVLRNGENDAVRVTIQDNLTSLDTMHLLVDGSED